MAYSIGFDIFARDRASKEFGKVGAAAETAGRRTDNAKRLMTLGLAVAGAAAIKFGKDSIGAYEDAEAQQRVLEDAYARFPAMADVSIEALRGQAAALQKVTRYDGDAVNSAQGLLGSFKLTGSQVQELTPLMLDYARKTGKDLPTAASVLGKAILGNGKALKDVGIKFKDTGTKAGNFDELVGGLRDQVGGFAEKEGKEAADQSAILGNEFGDLQEEVGSKLLPIVMSLTQAGLKMVAWIKDNPGPVKVLAAGFALFTLALLANRTAMAVQSAAAGIAAAKTVIVTGVTKGAAAAQWLMNAALNANPIGLVVLALAGLALGLKYAWDHSETFRRVVTTAFDAVKTAARLLWENGIRPVVNFILTGFSAVTRGIAGFLQALSNIPGFGWAADAAAKMRSAADWADRLKDQINNIPDAHTISIYRREVTARITAYRTIYNAQGSAVRDALADLRGYTTGGHVLANRAIRVGENGEELFVPDQAGTIVPHSKVGQATAGAAAPTGGATGGGITINVHGALDPVAVGRQVREALLQFQRATGGRALGLT